jgi:hypothetical protein
MKRKERIDLTCVEREWSMPLPGRVRQPVRAEHEARQEMSRLDEWIIRASASTSRSLRSSPLVCRALNSSTMGAQTYLPERKDGVARTRINHANSGGRLHDNLLMKQALGSVLDPWRAAIIGRRRSSCPALAPFIEKGCMDDIEVKHETDTVDSEAGKFRLVAAVLMILSIGFGVLELMNIIHI